MDVVFVRWLDGAGRDPAAIRSLILLHDIREGLLVEVAARFVLRAFVDRHWATSSVRHHQVLLVS